MHSTTSELHGVGLVVLGKGETSVQVLLEEGGLVGLKILQEDGVDGLLQVEALLGDFLLLYAYCKLEGIDGGNLPWILRRRRLWRRLSWSCCLW